jgi:WXXGXW repeat (2 copies)
VVVNERVKVQSSVNVNVRFVAQPPPPPRHEVVLVRERPSHEHIWINGYYVWREGRHVWIAGHWEHPPHPRAVWVEPRWEHHHEGYVFIEGFWR